MQSCTKIRRVAPDLDTLGEERLPFASGIELVDDSLSSISVSIGEDQRGSF